MQLPHHIKELQNLYDLHPEDFTIKRELGNNLLHYGNELYLNNKQEESLTVFQTLSRLFPSSSAVWHNIGYVHAELNQPYDAVSAYQKALQYDPNNLETHICLATSLLSIGDYKQGFAEYEWRWQQTGNALYALNIPVWNHENLQGKKILLRSEGSLGDVIQFIRYARIIKSYGAYVILQTHKALHPLFSYCDYVDEFIDDLRDLPTVDFQQSLMSLPFVLQTTLTTIPNPPYLQADIHLVDSWRQQIQHDTNFKIGICWQADPHNDAQRPPRAQRSIPLSLYAAFTKIKDTSWYSLQAVDGLDQCASMPELRTFGYDFDLKHGRFMDTAALMMHLDLIITVDTSIAHLAGALGRNVWLLLPYRCDWRWMHKGATCAWYPTMRIFRKSNPHDWSHVIEEVYKALIDYINTRSLPI
jgi:tetratricopeptide (TPR) repeat protein